MPSVSIIIPCYNEQTTICKLLEAIYAQTFPRADLEVVIADGISTDGTRAEIVAFADSHADLHIAVVDNLKRHIPAGLNCALKEAQGEIIVRLDAHSMPYPNYIEHCIADLEAGLGENVGGVWEIRPGAETWVARSIAIAAAHPLGVGDALYRHAEKSAPVDTVPFGLSSGNCWRWSAFSTRHCSPTRITSSTPASASWAEKSGSIRPSVRCISPGPRFRGW